MRLVHIVFAALACLASIPGRFVAAIERGVSILFDILARPEPVAFAGIDQAAFASPALAYDAPPAHSLRHEAGMSRRAAARGI